MKNNAALLTLILSCFMALPAIKAESPRETPKFNTEKEAIAYYQKKLEVSKISSFTDLYSALDINDDSKELKAFFAMTDPMVRLFSEKAGALIKVDTCLAPKLGDTIQRVGYILLYEHNVAFADTWFIHTQKGWHLASVKANFETETIKMLEAIPSNFFNK